MIRRLYIFPSKIKPNRIKCGLLKNCQFVLFFIKIKLHIMKKIFNLIRNEAYDFIYKLVNEPITKREYVLVILAFAIAIRFILF